MADFSIMNITELRACSTEHPEDKAAFHAFVDRFTSEANSTIYSMAQSPEEIQ